MDYLLNFPDAPYAGRPWQSYFNFTFVDARKPSFFAEGTVLRQVRRWCRLLKYKVTIFRWTKRQDVWVLGLTEAPWRTLLCTVVAALRFSPSSSGQRAGVVILHYLELLKTCTMGIFSGISALFALPLLEPFSLLSRDVLYVGDHIFGDVLKSKKLRGWRTFLIVPELNDEFQVLVKQHITCKALHRCGRVSRSCLPGCRGILSLSRFIWLHNSRK